jgi:hypothetical protein
MEMAGSRQRRWEEEENAMKERKENTEKRKRRDKVAVTRLRNGRHPGPRLPVLQRKIHTRTHPLAVQRNRERITKEVWKKGLKEAKMLVEYKDGLVIVEMRHWSQGSLQSPIKM